MNVNMDMRPLGAGYMEGMVEGEWEGGVISVGKKEFG